jgi:hypothetical protein
MLQARIRTVLGRVDDATNPLQTLATNLKQASSRPASTSTSRMPRPSRWPPP